MLRRRGSSWSTPAQHGNYAKPSFASPRTWTPSRPSSPRRGCSTRCCSPPSGTRAADEILRIAADRGADLIVIGLRRRSPVGKLFLGSTAQQMLLDAPCAVLAVKAPLEG